MPLEYYKLTVKGRVQGVFLEPQHKNPPEN